jgi:hypothetical protein
VVLHALVPYASDGVNRDKKIYKWGEGGINIFKVLGASKGLNLALILHVTPESV